MKEQTRYSPRESGDADLGLGFSIGAVAAAITSLALFLLFAFEVHAGQYAGYGYAGLISKKLCCGSLPDVPGS